MKKLAKILPVLLSCVMALSIMAFAAEDPAVTEPTTAVQEEITTEPTTEPEVTQPEEETTTQPEVTEPEVTEPTEPEKSEIVLPKAPENVTQSNNNYGSVDIIWDEVEDAEGYDVYLKVKDEWVYQTSVYDRYATVENLLCYSTYEVAVKSYITVDGIKYDSEEYSVATVKTPTSLPVISLDSSASIDGITLSWDTNTGVSGYRLYIRQSGKWVKITDINKNTTNEYLYKDVEANKEYSFAIKPFVRSTEGVKWGSIDRSLTKYPDYSKTTAKIKTYTNSSVTLSWTKVEGAKGYRVYIYKNNKWSALKTTKSTSYEATGLEASTKYKFKVRAYYKVNGKTVWCTYSDEVTVTTKQKVVKSFRVGKLKKYFTDGDWCVKIRNLRDSDGNLYDLVFAVKGDSIFARYTYDRDHRRNFEVLCQIDKEKVYFIFDDNKTYTLLPDAEAAEVAFQLVTMYVLLDMETAKGVTAKTTVYKSKTAVAEYYTDKDLGVKKTYYFIKDKLSGMKITYADNSTESFKYITITDTPSSSVFKIPSGYKKVAY